MFDRRNMYEFWKANHSGGRGGFSVDDLCKKLPDADLLSVDLRDNVSLTGRGHEYANWLVERGHKATFFECEYGGWGERPTDVGQMGFMRPMEPPQEPNDAK